VFLDESGLLMAPLVRRTWAPCGVTPILRQRTRSREKVSVVGVVTISPRRRRLGLYVALYPNANVSAPVLIQFLRDLRRHVRGPLVLIWDRLMAHRCHAMKTYLERSPQVHPEFLPAYAPELNPVEYVWAHLKGHRLANWAPTDAVTLTRAARRHVHALADNQRRLRGFVHATGLPLRLR
jgi:transposase